MTTQTEMIEYLWELPVGSFDDDNHAIQNLITKFNVTREEAERAVKFGPCWDEG